MSLITKILTAFRGGARQLGEAIVDKNSIRILEQEIKDGENALSQAKQDLTEVMAKEMQASRKIESLSVEIKKHEDYATQALTQNNEPLALEVAQKIADLQEALKTQKEARDRFAAHGDRLKTMLKKTSQSLNEMQNHLVMVRTTQNVQKAVTAMTQNYASGSSKLLNAKESLDRIKQRQQDLEDRLAAGEILQEDFSGKDLETKLKESGILKSEDKAQEILAALKSKQ